MPLQQLSGSHLMKRFLLIRPTFKPSIIARSSGNLVAWHSGEIIQYRQRVFLAGSKRSLSLGIFLVTFSVWVFWGDDHMWLWNNRDSLYFNNEFLTEFQKRGNGEFLVCNGFGYKLFMSISCQVLNWNHKNLRILWFHNTVYVWVCGCACVYV